MTIPVDQALDPDAERVLDALENLAARQALPAMAGEDAAISNDGRILIIWSDLNEQQPDSTGAFIPTLRADVFVRLSGDAQSDMARGVYSVFYLPGWGEMRSDGSRLTHLPTSASVGDRVRVGTIAANHLSAAFDTGFWHAAMSKLASADASWTDRT